MSTTIDLGLEVLVDGSTIRDPYERLLTAAVGQRLAPGSPWVAVNKRVAAICSLRLDNALPVLRRWHRSRTSPRPVAFVST